MAKTENNKLDEINQAFKELTDTGLAFIEKLKSCVTANETYFKQYVNAPLHSLDTIDTDEDERETDDRKSAQKHQTGKIKQKPSTPEQRVPAPDDPSKTPKLEGLSEYTLALFNQRAVVQRQEANAPLVTKPSAPTIPSPFQHNGFLCTPSLFPKCSDRAQSEGHASLASPIATFVHTEPDHSDTVPDPRIRLGFEGLTLESPKTPDLQTPGLKAKMTSNKKVTQNATKEPEVRHKASVSLFNPTLYEKQAYTYEDDEPLEPELTYSLEALQEMTGVYKINNQLPQVTKPSTTVHSTSVHRANKENTPTEPELLSERLAKLHKETAADPNNPSKPRVLYGEMPPSPKLMMNYDFLNK